MGDYLADSCEAAALYQVPAEVVNRQVDLRVARSAATSTDIYLRLQLPTSTTTLSVLSGAIAVCDSCAFDGPTCQSLGARAGRRRAGDGLRADAARRLFVRWRRRRGHRLQCLVLLGKGPWKGPLDSPRASAVGQSPPALTRLLIAPWPGRATPGAAWPGGADPPAGHCRVTRPAWGQSTIGPPEPAPPPRLVLRVAVGASYLHERWDPHDGGPPAVTSGFGPSVEVAIGRRLSSRLVVGGAWQTMAVIDPEQTYLGTRYELTSVVKAIDALSVFGDYVVVLRFHCRLGLALGAPQPRSGTVM